MSLGTSVADLLAESLSVPSAFNKNSGIGETVTGTVVDAEVRQSRDFDNNEPEHWKDGSPVLQLVVKIQTDAADDADDDGIRGVYIKWYGAQRKALLTAIKDAGATDFEPGAAFTATYIGDGEQPDKKKSAPKLYAYTYKSPGALAKAAAAGK